ncbi:MAG TPA: VWA domain-containing protein [Terriglobales bacterium]|nr:VWA domain-containing protein [Terriglobales bacterium]
MPVFRRTVGEVHLTLVATDKHGRPIADLHPIDFVLTDQGQRVSIVQVQHAADLPLNLGVVVDLSDSTHKNWQKTQAAAARLLGSLMRNNDRLFVLAFDTQIELQREVDSPARLSEVLLEPGHGGQTALYDAIIAASQGSTERDCGQPRRSALIVFSDGEDNHSTHNLYDAIAVAQREELAIYTIAIHSRHWKYPGDEALRLLTTQSGGRDFIVSNDQELERAIAEVADELRNSYAIFYHAPNSLPNGRFRTIHLQPLNGSLRLRSRAGYYLPAEQEAGK